MEEKTTGKKLGVFLAVAYGIPYLMMIALYFGRKAGIDTTSIVNAQMCAPAAGVALGFLLFNKGEKRVPRFFMFTAVIGFAVMELLGLLCVLCPLKPLVSKSTVQEMFGQKIAIPVMAIDIYNYAGQFLLVVLSILMIVAFIVAGRERRAFVGISNRNIKRSFAMVGLFFVLYLVKFYASLMINALVTGTMNEVPGLVMAPFKNPVIILSFFTLPENFILLLFPFFGEEYGWRYFLQGILGRKFGKRAGVLILGVAWSLWHLPVDIFYYTEDTIPQMIVAQLVTCVSASIIMGYAYLKTNNIWVPVAIHFINNNMIPILSASTDPAILRNQSITWTAIAVEAVVVLFVYCLFIFSKTYNGKLQDKVL